MLKLLTIFTQMFTISAAILMGLAYSYETLGTGLHPFIALPLSTWFLILPHMVDHWFIEIVPDDDEPSFIKLKDPEHPQTEADYICNDAEIAALEREHLGDPIKKTGIYHSSNDDPSRVVFPPIDPEDAALIGKPIGHPDRCQICMRAAILCQCNDAPH